MKNSKNQQEWRLSYFTPETQKNVYCKPKSHMLKFLGLKFISTQFNRVLKNP